MPKKEASFRGLAFHSEPGSDDAVSFGASKIDWVQPDFTSLERGGFPGDLAGALYGLKEAARTSQSD